MRRNAMSSQWDWALEIADAVVELPEAAAPTP